MTKLLDQAFDAVRALPVSEQEEIARAMLALAGAEDEPETIAPEDLAAVLEGLNEGERGLRASAPNIERAFRRFDR